MKDLEFCDYIPRYVIPLIINDSITVLKRFIKPNEYRLNLLWSDWHLQDLDGFEDLQALLPWSLISLLIK